MDADDRSEPAVGDQQQLHLRVQGALVDEVDVEAIEFGEVLVKSVEARIAFGDTLLHYSVIGLDLPVHQRGIGYVFQDAPPFSHLTIAGNLRFAQRRELPANGGAPAPALNEEVAQLADEVLILNAGQVTARGEVHAVLEAPEAAAVSGDFEAGVVLDARVVAQIPEYALTEVEVAGQAMYLPRVSAAAGAPLRLRVRARRRDRTAARRGHQHPQPVAGPGAVHRHPSHRLRGYRVGTGATARRRTTPARPHHPRIPRQTRTGAAQSGMGTDK